MAASPTLKRSIGLLHATAMVAGIIVGASIFVQPSEISRYVPGVTGMLGVWLGAGLLTFFGALVCARFAALLPHTGGVYVYLRESISPAAGFLWGWAMLWSMHSGILAAIAVIFARYAGYFVPLDGTAVRAAAIAAILVLSAINYVGVKQGSIVQTFLTAVKVLAIALIVVVVFAAGKPVHRAAAAPSEAPGLSAFLLAIGAGVFAFGGWHMVTYAAGETRDPGKTIPRALLLGTLLVTACYLGMNAAYLRVLPVETVANSTRIAADAAGVVVGPRGAAAISALVIISAFGALNGIILAGPRVYLAMARDGLLFQWMAAVHPRFRTPHRAILVQAVWTSILVATGTYRSLFTRVVYTEWIFFALMTAGLLRMKRGNPIFALLFIAACALIVVNQVAADPGNAAVGLLLVAAGLPVYYLFLRGRAAQGAHKADADYRLT
jgi:APA family basic amino acid/polyamine antiporter